MYVHHHKTPPRQPTSTDHGPRQPPSEVTPAPSVVASDGDSPPLFTSPPSFDCDGDGATPAAGSDGRRPPPLLFDDGEGDDRSFFLDTSTNNSTFSPAVAAALPTTSTDATSEAVHDTGTNNLPVKWSTAPELQSLLYGAWRRKVYQCGLVFHFHFYFFQNRFCWRKRYYFNQ